MMDLDCKTIGRILNIISIVLVAVSIYSIIYEKDMDMGLKIATFFITGINLLIQGSFKAVSRILEGKFRKRIILHGLSFIFGMVLIFTGIILLGSMKGDFTWLYDKIPFLDKDKVSVIPLTISMILNSFETLFMGD